MRKDPKEFRERFQRWKAGEQVYKDGLPAYEDGKEGEFDAFLKTLPDNQSAPGAYNIRRYWELNGKPKNFAEAIGMYNVQEDDGILGWHANSVSYNDKNDTYEFMKPNYHPTRWMEQVYGYDKDPMFQKDWKVQYNGPMLSDRYIRREKPGFKIKGGQLPKFADGKESNYFRPNGNQIKIDENTGELVDLVNGERGTLQLPEVAVTAAHPNSYRSSYDPNVIRNFTDWLPVVGDIGTGIDIKNAIQNQNYAEAGLLGGMMLLPAPLAKVAKKAFRPITKNVKRIFQNVDYTSPLNIRVPDAENQTWADITAAKYANKIASKNPIKPSQKDKDAFKRAWELATMDNPVRSVEEVTNGFSFTNPKDKYRFVNLINRNPEYYEFLRREGIVDPMSQESVSKFLDNQFTSVRGVVADNVEQAKPMLTNTELNRFMSGGDRLDTHGGIYTSNSTTIADRFKNPQGSKIGNGYVAVLKYPHNISTDLPIEDQLEQYRKKILLADNKNPLFGTQYYLRQRYTDPNVVALEADYRGRASAGDKSVQERAYLPTGTSRDPKKTLDIVSLQEYKNQSDTHGRWLADPEPGSKNGLFIPRTLNNYSDFVRSARIVLAPQPNTRLYRTAESEALENFSHQGYKRQRLISKLDKRNNKLKRLAGLSAVFGAPLGVVGYALSNSSEARQFYDSPEYSQFLNDPLFEKYSNLDDGGFLKEGSLSKLERKYRYKYKKRIANKK